MTAALLEAPRRSQAQHAPPDARVGGGLTLEELLAGAWRGLKADGEADCPVCRARMSLVERVGECSGCGSRLA